MTWMPEVLAAGTVPTSYAAIFNPQFDTIIKAIVVVNEVGADTTLVIRVRSVKGNSTKMTNMTVLTGDTFIFKEPITLRAGVDYLDAIAGGSGLSYTLTGVVNR